MTTFPLKCSKCKERQVQRTVLDYRAAFEHDGRAYDFVVPGLSVLQCQRCGTIVLDDQANKLISAAFRQHAGLLPPNQIRQHRERLGLTQKQLAAFLDVSVSTLSRWETDAQIQQRAMDKLLRGFFTVPEFRYFLGYRETVQQQEAVQAVVASGVVSVPLMPIRSRSERPDVPIAAVLKAGG